jgi:hypothetical protein
MTYINSSGGFLELARKVAPNSPKSLKPLGGSRESLAGSIKVTCHLSFVVVWKLVMMMVLGRILAPGGLRRPWLEQVDTG